MKRLYLVPLLLVSGCAMRGDAAVEPTPEARDRLASALEGRVADPPVACVRRADVRGNRIIDSRTILFDGPGSIVYLNRTRNSCAGIRDWHALRFRRMGTQMCEGDLVVAFAPTTGIEYGGCTLGEFEPYRRAE